MSSTTHHIKTRGANVHKQFIKTIGLFKASNFQNSVENTKIDVGNVFIRWRERFSYVVKFSKLARGHHAPPLPGPIQHVSNFNVPTASSTCNIPVTDTEHVQYTEILVTKVELVNDINFWFSFAATNYWPVSCNVKFTNIFNDLPRVLETAHKDHVNELT